MTISLALTRPLGTPNSSDSSQIFLGGPWGVSRLAYKQQKFVLHSSGAGSPKTKFPADSVSGEGLLHGSCVFTEDVADGGVWQQCSFPTVRSGFLHMFLFLSSKHDFCLCQEQCIVLGEAVSQGLDSKPENSRDRTVGKCPAEQMT